MWGIVIWWIIEVFILTVFSIHSGSWVAKRLYENGWFRYERMEDVKVLSIVVVGIISLIFLAIRP